MEMEERYAVAITGGAYEETTERLRCRRESAILKRHLLGRSGGLEREWSVSAFRDVQDGFFGVPGATHRSPDFARGVMGVAASDSDPLHCLDRYHRNERRLNDVVWNAKHLWRAV